MKLLGVRAVIAESYERIHRSNLIAMGVLPLEFLPGESWKSLNLEGDEVFSIEGIAGINPKSQLTIKAESRKKGTRTFEVNARLDNEVEVEYLP